MKRLFAVMFCLAWLAACTNNKTTIATGDTSAVSDTSDTSGLVPNHIRLIKPRKPAGSPTDEVDRALAIQAMNEYGTSEGGSNPKPGAIRDSSNKVVSGVFLSKENIMTLLNEPGVRGITIRFGKPVDPNQQRPRTYTMYYYGETNPGSFPLGEAALTGKIFDYVPPIR